MSDVTIDRAVIARASSAPGSGVALPFEVLSDSSDPERVPDSMPAAIPADQRYYWSVPWQNDIREAVTALRAGEYEDFDSDDPNDVVRWLFDANLDGE